MMRGHIKWLKLKYYLGVFMALGICFVAALFLSRHRPVLRFSFRDGAVAENTASPDAPTYPSSAAKVLVTARNSIPVTSTSNNRLHFHDSVDRSTEYCNSLETVIGNEGSVDGELRLVNVHVLVRHGDRSPMGSLPDFTGAPLQCELRESHPQYELHQRFKHVLNSKFSSSNAKREQSSQNMTCSSSQLTPRGVFQHIKLGRYLANVYSRHFPALNQSNETDDVVVYARSTNKKRTYHSAVALLYGFTDAFRHGWLSKLEKGTADISLCSEQYSGVSCWCPFLRRLKTFKDSEQKQYPNYTQYREMRDTITVYHGVNATDLPGARHMLDVAMSYVCHGRTLPCSTATDGRCVDMQLIDKLWRYADAQSTRDARGVATRLYHRLLMRPLLSEILRRYQAIAINTSPTVPQFVFYSAHDMTLSSMAIALGLGHVSSKWIPYASRFVFELYHYVGQVSAFRNEYFFRVLFNGVDYTDELQICDTQVVDDVTLCSVEDFQRYLSLLPSCYS